MESLDTLIKESLIDLARYISSKSWRGREREAVSLYAFGFLAVRCKPNSLLHTPTQIGLDVAVCQNPGERRKKLVCKDLVIWPDEAGNCWDVEGKPTRHPLAIIEWKARTEKVCKYDEDWLVDFSKEKPEFTGYAVSIYPKQQTTIVAGQVRNGRLSKDWLRFSSA